MSLIPRIVSPTLLKPSSGRLVAAVAVAALTTLSGSSPARAQDSARNEHGHSQDTIVFTVDVAEDFPLFVPTKVNPEDPQPLRGSFFVTEGNIYPAGTIQGDGASFDPRSAGAVGRWFCRGTHLVAGSEFPNTAQAVYTAQLYLLPNDKKSISTDGVEGNGKAVRTVTGGTGRFRGYVGEQRQQFLGFNASGGVNLRVTFILKKAAH
jgi:hypothetical protein